METPQQNINLLKIQSTVSPLMGSVFRILKNSAYTCLVVLIAVGIILGAISIALTLREESVQTEQKNVANAITAAVTKEGMIVDLRTRLTVIDEIIKKQKSPLPFIDSMSVITEGMELTGLTIAESNSITVSMKLSSITDAQVVVSRIMKLVMARTINFPMLESFTLDEIGGIQMNVSFKVII